MTISPPSTVQSQHMTLSSGQISPYLPASTPRSADVVLYLDLDGVVHHEKVLWHPRRGIYMSPYEAAGHSLFEWVPILESVLQPHPAVALVLSSTWCIRPGYSATLKRLPASLRARFIGGTYHRRVHGVDPWNLICPCFAPRPGACKFKKTLSVENPSSG